MSKLRGCIFFVVVLLVGGMLLTGCASSKDTVAKEDVDKALEILRANGEDAYIIGEIIESDEKVILE